MNTSILVKALKILLLVVLLLAVSGYGYLKYTGVWNALFPSSENDTVAPDLPDTLVGPAIMVFSKTNGFRHVEGIESGGRALVEIAGENGWAVYATENGAVFNTATLERFDAVVFLSASGDMLSTAQQLAFQGWLEGGGGWLGIHAAGDGSHAKWRWYVDNLIGAEFTAHPMRPQFQNAVVLTEAKSHPVMRGLPTVWEHVEEWYSWADSPRTRGFTILATIDESSYTPVLKLFGQEKDLSMGDHPVAWSNCVASGGSVYLAMGHQEAAFENPLFLQMIENSLLWLIEPDREGCRQ